jgi:hypothetical protein
MQSSIAERRQRAENLILRILQLRKPIYFDKVSVLQDTKRVLQTLIATEFIANQNERLNK